MKAPLTTVAVAFFASMSIGFAAETIQWTWDNALGSWGTAWGQAATQLDQAQDNTGNGGGSLHVATDYSGNPPEDNRNVVTVMGNYGGWLWNGDVRTNLLGYQSLEFDLRWDSAVSTLSISDFNNPGGGDNGLVVYSARYAADWQWDVELARILIPESAANGWVHFSIPINPVTANLDESAGIMFKKWVPQEVADGGGVAAFWIDNVTLIPSEVPVDPPTLSVNSDVQTGLNLITLTGSQWQRQGIRTTLENFSWVGSDTPTTYEFTVSHMPDTAYAGLHVHLFLAPEDPRTSVGVDWDLPDIVRFEMSLQDDGSGLATFRYKTDAPGSNGAMYGGEGELGAVTHATATGRWGFTFNDDTSITLFSPGMTTNIFLPQTAVSKFSNPLTVYFGCMPNTPENVGQMAVLDQVKIQGAAGGADLTDDFEGPLDAGTWELAAEHPDGVLVLNDDAALWLNWTLPDSGFALQAASGIDAGDWASYAGETPPLPTGTTKSVLISKSGAPGETAGYWRLKQREFSKLQILLPGETAAPGTATGKTGTPDPQLLYGNFDITVNAVSDDWALVRNVSDTVTFSSTDSELLAEDITLVNGSATAVMNMGTAGTHTITASDLTNPAIASGTSSEFTVTPQ